MCLYMCVCVCMSTCVYVFVSGNTYYCYLAILNTRLLLTSTATPGSSKISIGLLSPGVQRQNSSWPLYHVTEYSVSPSRSQLQSNSTASPVTWWAGTEIDSNLRASTPPSLQPAGGRKEIFLSLIFLLILSINFLLRGLQV